MILVGVVVVALLAFLTLGRRGDSGPEVELSLAESRDVFRSYVTASGEILAERYADVGSSVMGRVVELPVAEGQEVNSGDLLARIDPVQARSELDAASAAIRALEAEAQSASEQIVLARAELQLAEAQAREAAANFERLEALYEAESRRRFRARHSSSRDRIEKRAGELRAGGSGTLRRCARSGKPSRRAVTCTSGAGPRPPAEDIHRITDLRRGVAPTSERGLRW